MIIDANISKYLCRDDDLIIDVLAIINKNKCGIAFVADKHGRVLGVVTDGDFRRWLIQSRSLDLNVPVTALMNRDFLHCRANEAPSKIAELFSSRYRYLPLLDDEGRLVSVANNQAAGISFGDFVLDEDAPCFIIAEIANNHNGDMNLALTMVDEAAKAGANCAKFQLRHMESLYRNSGNPDDPTADLGAQYTMDLLAKNQLKPREFRVVLDHCKEVGLTPLCTPWDLASLAWLEDYGMQAYKIASADLTNHDLLTAMADTRKPLLCSTGMSTEPEIQQAVDIFQKRGAPFILLHCISTYPAAHRDVNLKYLKRLQEIGRCLVGYSGHELGVATAIAAVAVGAKVVEKHFTLDKTMEGNDHRVSLLPEEFAALVEGVRQVEAAMGTADPRSLTQGERMNRETLAKSLVINRDIKAGEVITEDMLEVKSPGQGLQPNRKQELIGRASKRPMSAGGLFFESDLSSKAVTSRDFDFNRPWGIPVRYHDYADMLTKTNLQLLEFHMSYKDMECKISDYLQGEHKVDLVVHSPELFAQEHILDLCSEDADYRARSLALMQEVINTTRELKKYFPKTDRPLIITNVGGFTPTGHLAPYQRRGLYQILAESLGKLDMEGVEVIIQTMPPLPWHFGGQRFHNLFVDPWETAEFCATHGVRLCLDVSHTKLACNHNGWSFRKAVEALGPHTAHLHLADAASSAEEGLQIGDGDMDFPALLENLDRFAPQASFIPEVWQGHKNSGEGFWVALDKLEKFWAAASGARC